MSVGVADIETGGFCVELGHSKTYMQAQSMRMVNGFNGRHSDGLADLAAATAASVKGGCGWQRQPRTREPGDRKTAFVAVV